MDQIRTLLSALYPGEAERIGLEIERLLERYPRRQKGPGRWVDERDVMVITYGDTIVSAHETGIQNLLDLCTDYIKDSVSAIHLLPFYPYSSDDGFSVIDYKKPRREIGTWDEIKTLADQYDLMFDAVINHISRQSSWFQRYLDGEGKYSNYLLNAILTLTVPRLRGPERCRCSREWIRHPAKNTFGRRSVKTKSISITPIPMC